MKESNTTIIPQSSKDFSKADLIDVMAHESLKRQASIVGSSLANKLITKPLACANCGSTKGVHLVQEYIGGIGIIDLPCCDNPKCESK